MKKGTSTGRVVLILLLSIVLTSCTSDIQVNRTTEEPSRESVDIFNKVMALTDTLKYNDARKLLEDKYDVIKDNDAVLNTYGFMEFHMFQNYQKAEALFKRAIELNPDNPENYRGMGCIYEAKGEYKKAVGFYEKAVKRTASYKNVPLNPKEAALYADIGNCYLELNDTRKALAALEIAEEKNPFNIKANAVLHKIYVEREEYGKAYKVWRNDNLIDENGNNVYDRVAEWNRLYKAAVESKNAKSHLEMADLYARLILYDEAAIEYKKALAQEMQNTVIKQKLYEVEVYLSFRDELRNILDGYYRDRCINGMREEAGFYNRLKPAYEKIAVLFPHIDGSSLVTATWVNMINSEIEKKFKVRIVSIPANGSLTGAHFGRIIDSSTIHSSLWGKEADLKVITLKSMVSNGVDYWRLMERGGVGGWSISPTEIVKVIQDNGYDIELQIASFYNEAAREAMIKEYGGNQEVGEEKEPLQIYFSPNISFRFVIRQMEIEAEKAKAQGIAYDKLQVYLFKKLEKDLAYRSNIIHESQHSIDNKTGAILKWPGEAEYKAKLSQLAYGNMQFMCLNQFYTSDIGMDVNNSHTRANTRLFKDIVQYVHDNVSIFPQVDINKNILAQLDKLDEDDLEHMAIDIFERNYPDDKYQ